ncbi:unnamed protein product [Dibothriocephalus latus]|uniref:Uncharacterized protein n=1 Tax=Dibothriocephalus latus TaxID=60516 RepID=A0A3P7LNU8_DIBLA|nr:unnamed protein product [Dibothriocephalus latus]
MLTAKLAREDWKKYWAEIATSIEQASNVDATRKVYQLIRNVSLSCDPPSEGEIADATVRLSKNKAPEEDSIPAELPEVIGQVWRDEAGLDDWGSGVFLTV